MKFIRKTIIVVVVVIAVVFVIAIMIIITPAIVVVVVVAGVVIIVMKYIWSFLVISGRRGRKSQTTTVTMAGETIVKKFSY